MYINFLNDIEENEAYCDVCHDDLNDIRELQFEGHVHGEFLLCIDCRKMLVDILNPTLQK